MCGTAWRHFDNPFIALGQFVAAPGDYADGAPVGQIISAATKYVMLAVISPRRSEGRISRMMVVEVVYPLSKDGGSSLGEVWPARLLQEMS